MCSDKYYNTTEKLIKTYCVYCKDPIYEGQDYVVSEDRCYHTECYKLIQETMAF